MVYFIKSYWIILRILNWVFTYKLTQDSWKKIRKLLSSISLREKAYVIRMEMNLDQIDELFVEFLDFVRELPKERFTRTSLHNEQCDTETLSFQVSGFFSDHQLYVLKYMECIYLDFNVEIQVISDRRKPTRSGKSCTIQMDVINDGEVTNLPRR